MATPLTWRNVEGPTASNVSPLLNQAMVGFNQGMDVASRISTAAQKNQQDQLNSLALQQQLRMQDPNVQSQFYQMGGLDPNVSADTVQKIIGNQAGMQGNATANLKYNTEQVNAVRVARDGDVFAKEKEAGRDWQNALNQAALTRNSTGLAQITDQMAKLGISPETITGLVKNAQEQQSAAQTQAGNSFDLGSRMTDRAESRTATTGTQAVMERRPQTQAEAIGYAQDMFDAAEKAGRPYSLIEKKLITEQIGNTMSAGSNNINAPFDRNAPATGGGTTGSGESTSKNPLYRTNGDILNVPEGTTFGQYYGSNAKDPNSMAATARSLSAAKGVANGQGSSVVGPYQINQGTWHDYAPKVLGPNWQNMPFSQDSFAKVAGAILTDRVDNRGQDIVKTWEGLKNATPDEMALVNNKNVSMDKRLAIVQKYEGGLPPLTPDTVLSKLNVAGNTATTLQQQPVTNGFGLTPQSFRTLATDGRDVSAVSAGIKKEVGDFAKVPDYQITAKVNQIMKLGKEQGVTLNPAQAGQILKGSLDSQWWAEMVPWKNDFSKTSAGLNMDRVKEGIKAFGSNDAVTAVSSSEQLDQLNASALKAGQAITAAQASLAQAKQRNAESGGRLQAEEDKAQRALDKAVSAGDAISTKIDAYSQTMNPPPEKTEAQKLQEKTAQRKADMSAQQQANEDLVNRERLKAEAMANPTSANLARLRSAAPAPTVDTGPTPAQQRAAKQNQSVRDRIRKSSGM